MTQTPLTQEEQEQYEVLEAQVELINGLIKVQEEYDQEVEEKNKQMIAQIEEIQNKATAQVDQLLAQAEAQATEEAKQNLQESN